MPTNNTNTQPTATPITEDLSAHATCPPEVESISYPAWRNSPLHRVLPGSGQHGTNAISTAGSLEHSSLSHPHDGVGLSNTIEFRAESAPDASLKQMAGSDEDTAAGRLSPDSERSSCSGSEATPITTPSTSSLLSYEFSSVRLLPNHSSSFLRAGSKFIGTQQSDCRTYNVDVEIKHVDMAESYLCGYLRIQGLTEDHPTLTTFFEGEIIGTKHTFQTRHEAWGATEKTDMLHWARFPAWKPLAKQAKRPDFTYRNFAQREHIFMRWKEYFLVPDHRVRTIAGASFEGFYYICFNQVKGTVSGIYFHAKSEKFQQLELKHVENHGCTPAVEFR
ncbi:hypothetical protein MAP00_000308 [Monascus purpureus]|nr:hypothetical protein MAP00_000308 [Monascus purpureus]